MRTAGVNLIDHFTVSGSLETKPKSPNIQGAEILGIIQRIGKHVTREFGENQNITYMDIRKVT
jgi:NADPH:quinone reductase-like Zn-dependent oxidoreductase